LIWKDFEGLSRLWVQTIDLARKLSLNSRIQNQCFSTVTISLVICFSAKFNKFKHSKKNYLPIFPSIIFNKFQILKYILLKRAFAFNSARIIFSLKIIFLRHFTSESKSSPWEYSKHQKFCHKIEIHENICQNHPKKITHSIFMFY